ncbi:MAG: fibronectin type III domain-containing protein [Armatimonadetes bacterium]|nr:fibronectin type III domain-containing protein [Armatimonadota bacterium]
MKLAQFLRLPDASMARSGAVAATKISAAPAEFGLQSSDAVEIDGTMTAFVDAQDSLEAAELVYRAAVAAKNDARTRAEQTFSKYMQVSYAVPSVTNETLTGIGLDAKTTGPTPQPLHPPRNLTAAPRETGFVALRWQRNGNTNSTIYAIEAQLGDGPWKLITSTTRTRIEIRGFEPGVQVSFRVVAEKSGKQSEPSNEFVIYRKGGNLPLTIAA